MDVDQILAEFGVPEKLPKEAIAAATAQREAILPHFLAALDAFTAESRPFPDNAANPYYLVLLLLGTWHEQRAYRNMAHFLRSDSERLYQALGDALTEETHRVMVNVFDGDPAPLYEVIEDQEADEYVRSRLIQALPMLVRQGALPRAEIARYLRDAYSNLYPQSTSHIWYGWQSAIALLGLAEYRDLVRRAFQRDWIDPSIMSCEHFEEDLNRTLANQNDPALFEREGLTPFGNIIEELSWWSEARADRLKEELARRVRSMSTSMLDDVREPITNPLRKVGRNDPCPCGSGKKFKECCGR